VHGQLAEMLVGIDAVQLLDGLGNPVVKPRMARALRLSVGDRR
jgi:hypothetical protein